MFLTLEYLEKNKACENGKKWFAKYFPEGAELTEILQHRSVRFSPEFLHWGYNHLVSTPEERELYWQAIKVNCEKRDTIFESDNVVDSEYISKSSKVENSEYVFSSKKVTNSQTIVTSENVENSEDIFASSFIQDSNHIINSQNTTNSSYISSSTFVIDSHDLVNGENIENSAFLAGFSKGQVENIKNSYFIFNGANLNNCLFCSNLFNKEFYLFNKPISQSIYTQIVTQLSKLLKGYHMCIIQESWPEKQIPINMPSMQQNFSKIWGELPQDFFEWLKTLPNYSEDIVKNIFFKTDI